VTPVTERRVGLTEYVRHPSKLSGRPTERIQSDRPHRDKCTVRGGCRVGGDQDRERDAPRPAGRRDDAQDINLGEINYRTKLRVSFKYDAGE
jgi:hypothetical protein